MAERPSRGQLRLNRRRLFAGSAAVVAAGATLTQCSIARSSVTQELSDSAVEPFHGRHQAGITTAPQAHALFVALDLAPAPGRGPRDALAAVLKLWTSDAARLTQGRAALADTEPELAQRPARLTVTVGLGPRLFDRIALGHRRPRAAAEPPGFATDRLEPQWCGGDLLLQICADDPITLAHTSRVLLKNVRTMTTVRWRQTGFRNAAGGRGGSMRNLMGQIDGTVNITDAAGFDRHVWHDGEDQPWFAGGTILVLRRIRAEMDTWDEIDRASKELAVGRRLDTGAPLTGSSEFDEPDFAATDRGIPVIPPNSHIAVARHRSDDERFLRRPYNYDDAPPTGRTTDSGLIFATYQRDPAAQFTPVQRRLAEADALNEWITTIGSATFAILPGVDDDGYLGESLLG
ncbi:Dyp-type peroxidase [Mycolicibacterium flavescens]|uniref:Peroxidase n=1 Tax=Mycolicibacterium flavescens TaxID=1776 RepID=A0A1E3RJS8_MYCFV|nr:Dyp-type peroxidase [Mycolicibacterium flavescens]MCV7282472.1 Dyp-type peroxidase [Mycolicibacterium flavescens]ODQ90109.1 peroxidase [Mycolicibacterium flavescens]